MITELRAEQKKHGAGSQLQKLLCWAELHIADQFSQITELEQELKQAEVENGQLRMALHLSSGALEVVHKFTKAKAFEIPPDTFARDFAPWTNIMAANGMKTDGAPIAKKGRKAK